MILKEKVYVDYGMCGLYRYTHHLAHSDTLVFLAAWTRLVADNKEQMWRSLYPIRKMC